MHVQVHYQNLDNSQWMDQFIETRVNKLNKYLSTSSTIHVNLRHEKQGYVTTLAIHNPHHDYAFNTIGENMYESFSVAVDKAVRALGEQNRKVKDKIHKKFLSVRQQQVVP